MSQKVWAGPLVHKLKMAALIACWIGLMVLGVLAQAPSRFSSLLQQLQAPETSDRAAQKLLKLGRTDQEARMYLAVHLPPLIERNPVDPTRVWGNAVHLATELKIAEATPALAKWIGVEAGTTTFAEFSRLDNNPAGKALAKIGDPAIPAVIDVLNHGNLHDRNIAVLVLKMISSPSAKNALSEYLPHEPDPDLKGLIEKILANWPTSTSRKRVERQPIVQSRVLGHIPTRVGATLTAQISKHRFGIKEQANILG